MKSSRPRRGLHRRETLLLICLCLFMLWSEHGDDISAMEKIRRSGELRFVTVISPLTYIVGENGVPGGLEYELANSFARQQGLKLKIIVVDDEREVISLLKNNKAHLGSASMTARSYPAHALNYAPAYAEVKHQLVYRRDNMPAELLLYLKGKREALRAEDGLQRLPGAPNGEGPELFPPTSASATQTLKNLCDDDSAPFAIAVSNWTKVYRKLCPELRVGFDVSDAQPVAWLYQEEQDYSLRHEVNAFFNRVQSDDTLARLLERYYWHTHSFDYFDIRAFIRKIDKQLPIFKPLFIRAAGETGINWALLAAVSYQESHWDPKARSPTGVRGMMMLTRDTAASLAVEDRTDPWESVRGGAHYLVKMMDKIPERITGSDRVYLALAAYNVGFGHLEDARMLTQSQGGDPDQWLHVSERLPLLTEEHWYRQTRNGYARGWEPVRYVRNIRRYYDILNWRSTAVEQKTETLDAGAGVGAQGLWTL